MRQISNLPQLRTSAATGEEEHRFTASDVFNAISDKLISRHPFIFQPQKYDGESWEQIKMHEGRKSVLEGVPVSLPPLVKAVRLQEKAAGIGVDPTLSNEQDRDMIADCKCDSEESFGNLLFNLIHWAHEHGINADTALARANIRFQDKVKNFEQRLLFPFHLDTHQLQCVANFEIGIVYLKRIAVVD